MVGLKHIIMKKLGISIGIVALVIGMFSFVNEYQYRNLKNTSYVRGEKLLFRAHYGFVNAGYGEVTISDKLYKINDRICYKIETVGKSSNSFDFFIRIRDTWRSYVDTSSIIPHKFFRHIEEGKYRKTEEVFYNHQAENLRVVDKKRDIDKEYKVPSNVQDLVSGFYFLRNTNFNKLSVNDTIYIPSFLENEIYDLKLVYRGKGKVKTKLGKFMALKLTPIMPENSLFDGEESIRVWISDDKNKIPLKIEADMFIGAVEMDLEKADGLKYELNKL